MATSGSITTSNSSGYRNVTFQWSVKSQSIANNTTTISWSIVGAQNGADGWYYAGPFNLTIDGTKVVNNLHPSGDRIQLRAGTVVETGETTIAHAADGTRSFSATLTAAVYDLNTMSVSGTWSLDAIPRQSSASVASSYNIGSSHTINITRASTAYYHRVSYKYGSNSEVLISSNATTSATLNLGSWGSNIPSAMSADITIYLRTYPSASDASNATNQIGNTATYSTSFVVPSYSQATPSVTRQEANSANTTGVYVQSISKLRFTISATANYGATLSYKVVVAGQTMTSSSNVITTTSAIATSGTIAATITVTDSRGKSASTTLNTTVVAYSAPRITVAKAARSASNAAQITCTISCSVSSILNGSTEKNSMRAYAIYDTDTSFPSPSSTYQFSTSGISASNVSKTYTGLSTTSTYYIQFRVVDAFGYSSQIVKVGLGGILHITRGGVGILKRRENGTVDIEGSLVASDNAFFGNSDDASKDYYTWVRCANGDITLRVATSKRKGLYVPASGDGGAKWLIDADQDNNVLVDGKTPVYVSTNQSIGGIKTFTETPLIRRTGNYAGLNFQARPNTTGRTGGLTQYADASRTFFYFDQYHMSDDVQTTYLDQYRFPDSGTDNANHTYYFLTTKSAVTIAQGGTSATSAAGARSNLGIGMSSLYSGTFTSGSATLTNGKNFKALLLVGYLEGSSGVKATTLVPTAMLSGTSTSWQIQNESAYIAVNMTVSGTNITMAFRGRTNTSCALTNVYGVN